MAGGLPDLLGLEQGGHRVWGTKLEGLFQGVMRLLEQVTYQRRMI